MERYIFCAEKPFLILFDNFELMPVNSKVRKENSYSVCLVREVMLVLKRAGCHFNSIDKLKTAIVTLYFQTRRSRFDNVRNWES